MAEFANEEWYAQALKDSEMSLGNNVRLKKVIERAQAGEFITIGTMGGSITEGALASDYSQCWASRFAVRFGNTYGVDNGSNVALVNAGVGGTPSTFGYMRFAHDITDRISPKDPDGFADLVIIEFAVNDWNEPSRHRCFESMVKEVLQQPNAPAVIILFSVRDDGWNIQKELRKIGDTYDLLMVSIADGIYPHVGKEITKGSFFADEYHPNSIGHRMMCDCLMQAIADAAEKETDPQDIDLDVKPAYGTDFMGLKTLFADSELEGFSVERGGFAESDTAVYTNRPVGKVYRNNFSHKPGDPQDPLTITGTFSKCLIAWLATNKKSYGDATILVDGKAVTKLKNGQGKWGQSEVVLILDEAEPAEHTIEIRVTDPEKRFTINAISFR